MKEVTIYSDGACEGNPGPGGWAAVLIYGESKREVSGGEPATTNNRMEMTAAIEALTKLNQGCKINFYTDSQYLRQGITEWVQGWKRRGWKTKDKKPVRNEDLWRALDAAAKEHSVTWHWVKGHSGNTYNERCDVLAVYEIQKVKKHFSREQLKAALTEFRSAQEANATPRQSSSTKAAELF